ncbi:hypothetical protein BD410DRAFT_809565 [Rickenella mellea]|uniref:F-box domain-containing protein n=1 Tax=Rickenella mellea TaxID=50990 RepID=A0A4Y7PIJ4_9AGAM|nr:hypothetical protein BD410DRAFT_809565 [Rickenella mellea]
MPLVLEDGIRRMPDELLAHIFETGHNSTEDSSTQDSSFVDETFVDDPLDQTETLISRSGDTSLEVNLGLSRMKSFFRQHAFLKAVGLLSKRWYSVTDVSPTMVSRMAAVGLVDFPNLQHLNAFPLDVMLKWNMPLLTSIQGYTWFYTTEMQPLSQLTSINLRVVNEHLDCPYFFGNIACLELYNLKGLGEDQISPCTAEVPKPHSFEMETLKIDLGGSMSNIVVQPLYDALAYLAPSTLVSAARPRHLPID